MYRFPIIIFRNAIAAQTQQCAVFINHDAPGANDGTDGSVQLPRAESPSRFRHTHRNTPWAQRGMISQHQAWPSRIAYATRPLGVRCRPRESIPTQCPGRHVAWNFILPGGTQPARRRGARRRSKRGTAAITEGNDITARECAASAK